MSIWHWLTGAGDVCVEADSRDRLQTLGRWKYGGRLITHIDFLPSFPELAARSLCKSPISSKMKENSVKCYRGVLFFLCQRKKTASVCVRLASSRFSDACAPPRDVLQPWHDCRDTLFCKCHSRPIRSPGDAVAHMGFPPIKNIFCFPPCFFSPWRHSISKHAVHTWLTGRTPDWLPQHVSQYGSSTSPRTTQDLYICKAWPRPHEKLFVYTAKSSESLANVPSFWMKHYGKIMKFWRSEGKFHPSFLCLVFVCIHLWFSRESHLKHNFPNGAFATLIGNQSALESVNRWGYGLHTEDCVRNDRVLVVVKVEATTELCSVFPKGPKATTTWQHAPACLQGIQSASTASVSPWVLGDECAR